MKIRRVVTGHSPDGKAIFTSDESVEGTTTKLTPGMEIHPLWGGDLAPTFPDDGSAPSYVDYFPGVGGFRFSLVTIPPTTEIDLTNIDLDSAFAEMEQKWPGMAAHMDPDNPGMHTSNTVDYEYVISGEVWLELDDGKQVLLKAGDTVIQNGTRHAWRNKTDEPCRMVACLVGAHRVS